MFGLFGDTIEAATARLQAAQQKIGEAGSLMSQNPAAGGAAMAVANAELAKAATALEALQNAVVAPPPAGKSPLMLIGGGIAAAVVVMLVLKSKKS